jgi:hypothetical protein
MLAFRSLQPSLPGTLGVPLIGVTSPPIDRCRKMAGTAAGIFQLVSVLRIKASIMNTYEKIEANSCRMRTYTITVFTSSLESTLAQKQGWGAPSVRTIFHHDSQARSAALQREEEGY